MNLPRQADASAPQARAMAGFSLLEILMAVILLAIAFVGLSAYSGSQRQALGKSSDLTEATDVATTSLEKTKVPLSDSANFADQYAKLSQPKTTNTQVQGKKLTYAVTTTLSRVSGSSNLMLAKVHLTWAGGHSYNSGLILVQP